MKPPIVSNGMPTAPYRSHHRPSAAGLALAALLAISQARGAVHYAEIEGPAPGPRVAIVALPATGAPPIAVRQLRLYRPTRGRVFVAEQRVASGRHEGCWRHTAHSLDALVRTGKPDWLVLLTEDYDFHGMIPAAFGSTVACIGTPATASAVTGAIRTALNAEIDDDQKHWQVIAALARFDPHALPVDPAPVGNILVITTSTKNPRKEQHIALRTRQLRRATITLLQHLDMLPASIEACRLRDRGNAERIGVAIYDGDGGASSSGHGPPWIADSLRHLPFDVTLVDPRDIRDGALMQFDVVIFGGGLSSRQAKALDDKGRYEVHRFVRAGGGYIGICAGAFLGMTGRDSYLGFIDTNPSGTGGSGVVPLAFRPEAAGAIGISGTRDTKMSGGPRTRVDQLPPHCEVWATFAADLAREGKSDVELRDTAAIIAAPFGEGRVVLFSPHCERWPGPQQAFWRAIHWSAGRASRGNADPTPR